MSMRLVQGWLRAPAVRLAIVLHVTLLVAAAVLLVALTMPRYGASFAAAASLRGEHMVSVTLGANAPIVIPAETPVTVRGGGDSVTMPAATFVNDYTPPGWSDAVDRFFASRDRLGRIAAATDASLTLAVPGRTAVTSPLAQRPARLADLNRDVWLLVVQGCAIGLLGGWMWISAPTHLPARLYALSCMGVLCAALPGAVYDARELTGPGTLLQVMYTTNFAGGNMCAAGLLALFLHVPRPLASLPATLSLIAINGVLGVFEGLGVLPRTAAYVGLLVMSVLLVVVFARQWRLARGDPAGRAVLRWIGTGTFAGTAMLSIGLAAPILLDVPSFASDGMTIFPMLAIYGGIAFGVGKVRVFALDRWSYRLGLGTLGLALLLLADAALARLLRLDRPLALSLALLAVGYGYLPLRALVWRLVTGRREISSEALFRQAASAAFAATPQARREGWRDLLDRIFEPLELTPLDPAPGDVALHEDGAELLIPATADDGGLRLRFARRGSRLFAREDEATARELVALSAEAARARAEYARGVTEERQRIARDLHDDVSGLLLTGLHRTEVTAVRGDLRQALGEIRTMVASLAGRSQPLSVVLADLRFETAARLEAAGMALDWPVSVRLDEPDPELGYAHHKALTSALREIVTNAIKYSGGTCLAVEAQILPGSLTLGIVDDGIGGGIGSGPAAPRQGGGHGLGNIRQRLVELGGTCAILPGREGFRVELVLPLPASTAT